MTEGERLLDTNVLVHTYVRLNEKKQIASEIVLPRRLRRSGVIAIGALEKDTWVTICSAAESLA
jgi:hypothetical protein